MPQEYPLEISCQEVRARQQAGDDALLIDCREPDEYALAAIDGSRLLPMGEIPDRLPELAALSYYFVKENETKLAGNERFADALIQSKVISDKPDEAAYWKKQYQQTFSKAHVAGGR